MVVSAVEPLSQMTMLACIPGRDHTDFATQTEHPQPGGPIDDRDRLAMLLDQPGDIWLDLITGVLQQTMSQTFAASARPQCRYRAGAGFGNSRVSAPSRG